VWEIVAEVPHVNLFPLPSDIVGAYINNIFYTPEEYETLRLSIGNSYLWASIGYVHRPNPGMGILPDDMTRIYEELQSKP
jgi:hypothetical protein